MLDLVVNGDCAGGGGAAKREKKRELVLGDRDRLSLVPECQNSASALMQPRNKSSRKNQELRKRTGEEEREECGEGDTSKYFALVFALDSSRPLVLSPFASPSPSSPSSPFLLTDLSPLFSPLLYDLFFPLHLSHSLSSSLCMSVKGQTKTKLTRPSAHASNSPPPPPML